MADLIRVSILSNCRMVLPKIGKVSPTPEGEPVLLHGTADAIGEVAYVKLDDGREVLIRREHLTVLP